MIYNDILEFNRDYMIVAAADGQNYKLSEGTLAWRHNNPGNIKYGEFAKNFGAIGVGTGGHAVFPSYAIGAAAQKALLFSEEGNYYNLSIRDAIAKYAPIDDPSPYAKNNPPEYATYVADQIGVSMDTRLMDLTDSQQNALLQAMRVFEGYKVGTTEAIDIA